MRVGGGGKGVGGDCERVDVELILRRGHPRREGEVNVLARFGLAQPLRQRGRCRRGSGDGEEIFGPWHGGHGCLDRSLGDVALEDQEEIYHARLGDVDP